MDALSLCTALPGVLDSAERIAHRLDPASGMPRLSYLKECFYYEEDPGVLLWRLRPLSHFPDQSTYLRINSAYAGRPIASTDKVGRLAVGLDRKIYLVHRICYAWTVGRWPAPTELISTINGHKRDMRPENLQAGDVPRKRLALRDQPKLDLTLPISHYFTRLKAADETKFSLVRLPDLEYALYEGGLNSSGRLVTQEVGRYKNTPESLWDALMFIEQSRLGAHNMVVKAARQDALIARSAPAPAALPRPADPGEPADFPAWIPPFREKLGLKFPFDEVEYATFLDQRILDFNAAVRRLEEHQQEMAALKEEAGALMNKAAKSVQVPTVRVELEQFMRNRLGYEPPANPFLYQTTK